jgi:transposase
MSIRTVTTPTAVEQNSIAIYAAIEMSGSNWDVVVHTPASSKLSRYRLRAGDTAQLLELMERVAAKVARQAEQTVSVVSCYEAGYDGFWLHRVLSAQGLTNHVIDAASLQVDRRARRAKTDRLDGEALVLALMAWYRGERKACRMVRVPSPAEEDAKRGHRERERLIKERVQHVNRIKGLLATQGIVGFHPLHRQRRARLAVLSLPPHLQAEIERELVRLELLLEQITALEAERDALFAAAPAADDPVADKIRALARLKGIGPTGASVLGREAYYRSFRNRREVGSYVGLTPTPWRSGKLAREQGISKAGNARLRTTVIELAWSWLRYQPDSALARWFRDHAGSQAGRVRRIAIVAVARKLAVALWRYVETGIVPTGAVLKKA